MRMADVHSGRIFIIRCFRYHVTDFDYDIGYILSFIAALAADLFSLRAPPPSPTPATHFDFECYLVLASWS